MKIQFISDMHGCLPDGVDCDLLIIAGDICPLSNHELTFQRSWVETNFVSWLKSQKYKKAILVAGNHDFVFEQYQPRKDFGCNVTYLQDDYTTFEFERYGKTESLLIYGSPWCPEFGGDWAFGLKEEQLAEKWKRIPVGTDILITHTPARGFGCYGLYGAGSPSLTERIRQIQPLFHVCGHIHEGYGEYLIDETIVLNVASLDRHYNQRENPIWTVEL